MTNVYLLSTLDWHDGTSHAGIAVDRKLWEEFKNYVDNHPEFLKEKFEYYYNGNDFDDYSIKEALHCTQELKFEENICEFIINLFTDNFMINVLNMYLVERLKSFLNSEFLKKFKFNFNEYDNYTFGFNDKPFGEISSSFEGKEEIINLLSYTAITSPNYKQFNGYIHGDQFWTFNKEDYIVKYWWSVKTDDNRLDLNKKYIFLLYEDGIEYEDADLILEFEGNYFEFKDKIKPIILNMRFNHKELIGSQSSN